jgi:hypothetical protein
MHRSKVRFAAPVAMLTALVMVGAACTSPSDTDIYVHATPFPAGTPGDVLKTKAGPAFDNAKTFQIQYRSTDAKGKAIPVSGTIIVPNTKAAGSPVVAFPTETVGITDDCAPSKTFTGFLETPQLKAAVAAGFTIAMTDYGGLGPSDMEHTFMVGPSQAHTVLDMLRAATRTPDAGIPAGAPMAIWGYSQGGGAAGSAIEAAATYAPELPLKGVAAGGVPADLVPVAKFLDGGFFGFMAAAALGFDAAYPELNLDKYLNDTGRTEFANVKKGSLCISGMIFNYLGKHISDYTTSNPLDQPDWQARLAESKLGAKKPAVPAFLYHAASDEVIPEPQALQLKTDWCRQGVAVKWAEYGGEHIIAEGSGTPDAITWLQDRFAGKPVPTSC